MRCTAPTDRTVALAGTGHIGVVVAGRRLVEVDRTEAVVGCCSRMVVAESAGIHHVLVRRMGLDHHSLAVDHRNLAVVRRSPLVHRSLPEEHRSLAVVRHSLLAVHRIRLEVHRSLAVHRSRREGLGSTSLTLRRCVYVKVLGDTGCWPDVM